MCVPWMKRLPTSLDDDDDDAVRVVVAMELFPVVAVVAAANSEVACYTTHPADCNCLRLLFAVVVAAAAAVT